MMADHGYGGRRVAGGPRWTSSRKRWAMALAAAAVWLIMVDLGGSMTGGTILFVMAAALTVVAVLVARSFGIGRDHPLIRPLVARPWRDGQEVLHLALRHLRDVFLVTPSGSLLAPSAVDLCMNPDDVRSLADLIDLDLVSEEATQVYETEVATSGARLASRYPPRVSIVADPDVPPGRFRLRQSRLDHSEPMQREPMQREPIQRAPMQRGPVQSGPMQWEAGYQPGPAQARSPAGFAGAAPVPAGVRLDAPPRMPAGFPPEYAHGDPSTSTLMTGESTVAAYAENPVLRLITAGTVAQTQVSGARAGRGRAVELMLPGDLTVSRVHAKFTCMEGEWWITAMGTNGIVLNGAVLADQHVVHDGDTIAWGRQPGALTSYVEIPSSRRR